jgi:transposase
LLQKPLSGEVKMDERYFGVKKFWSYAKQKLLKFHGVSKANFGCSLKELEFRYNFRDTIDDSLYKCLGGIN